MRIVIEAISDVRGIWEQWCNPGQSLPPASTDNYAVLRERVLVQAEAMLQGRDRTRIGLILATTKGDIDAQVDWMRQHDAGEKMVDPPLLGDQCDAMASELQLGGPVWVVSTACSSGCTALADAGMALLEGEVEKMLVIGIDAASDFVRDGFQSLKAISPVGDCRPFDKNRDGLILGSGAAACLLSAQQTPKNSICVLSGWGIASDAVHRTAPDRNADGLSRAIQRALAMAKLNAGDIDAIIAHGTGTSYNDAMECVALEKLFARDNHRPAVTAVKGLIGHTLGASGIIETALAARILREQLLPPIPHLQSPMHEAIGFITRATHPEKPIRHVLKIASGFGGVNAAIIVSRGDAS